VFEQVQHFFEKILGLGAEPKELEFGQMILRALIIFFAALLMMKLAGRRFLAQRNPFDTLLAFLMASMLSRAINGSAAFLQTIGTGFLLALFYRGVAHLLCKSHKIGCWIKGEPCALVEDGAMHKDVMLRHNVSEHDLMEDLRLTGAVDDVEKVEAACLERNGAISVQRKPQIFTTKVENGVQTVKIQVT